MDELFNCNYADRVFNDVSVTVDINVRCRKVCRVVYRKGQRKPGNLTTVMGNYDKHDLDLHLDLESDLRPTIERRFFDSSLDLEPGGVVHNRFVVETKIDSISTVSSKRSLK